MSKKYKKPAIQEGKMNNEQLDQLAREAKIIFDRFGGEEIGWREVARYFVELENPEAFQAFDLDIEVSIETELTFQVYRKNEKTFIQFFGGTSGYGFKQIQHESDRIPLILGNAYPVTFPKRWLELNVDGETRYLDDESGSWEIPIHVDNSEY